MRSITWPVHPGSKIITYLKFPNLCCSTMWVWFVTLIFDLLTSFIGLVIYLSTKVQYFTLIRCRVMTLDVSHKNALGALSRDLCIGSQKYLHIWNTGPYLPIHYATFLGLRWWLTVVYTGQLYHWTAFGLVTLLCDLDHLPRSVVIHSELCALPFH